MTIHQPLAAFIDAQPLGAPTSYRPNRAERTFDLHPAVFGMLAGGFALFLLILGATFMNPELAIPCAIFAVCLGMFFGTPAMWNRVAPKSGGRLPSWAEFMAEGVQTGSGHLTGREALAQIFTLPALMIGWALAVAVIRAIA